MSEKLGGLRDKPIHINGHNWYYEEKKGVCFVHETYEGEGTSTTYIPWKRLLESVMRKYPGLKMHREPKP